jgi:hypothetical protein
MADSGPHRCRFQFRLQTLLIGVTVLAAVCGYVAWQAKIVKDRRAELQRTVDMRIVGLDGTDEDGVIPWIRRALGDERIATVMMPVGTSPAELDRLHTLFPEAKVEVWTPDTPTSLYR